MSESWGTFASTFRVLDHVFVNAFETFILICKVADDAGRVAEVWANSTVDLVGVGVLFAFALAVCRVEYGEV